MDDSLSDFIEVPLTNGKDVFAELDKKYQAYQLLIRNKQYMERVAELRKEYDVGEYEVETDNYYAVQDILDGPKDSEGFDNDVRTLSESIHFPGDWFIPVRMHILGFNPGGSLIAENNKKLLAKKHADYVELRIYGDITQPELRSALPELRKLIGADDTSESQSKFKPRLSKNLVIYDLHNKGLSYKQIAKYCEDHKLQANIAEEDVSKYIELAREQIEKMLA